MIDLSTLDHREHEVFERIITNEDWMRCQHDKHIIQVMAHWSDDAPFTVTIGQINHTQRFPRWVHSDGSPSNSFEYNKVSRCPQCKSLNTLKVELQAYGNLTTCTNCRYNKFYDIGD